MSGSDTGNVNFDIGRFPGSDTGNVNFDIGRFRKDMLCNIYKNNMSFFTPETLFRER